MTAPGPWSSPLSPPRRCRPTPRAGPAATAENVPGLEAATAEPGQVSPEPPPSPKEEPAPPAGEPASGEAGKVA
jgi:hypothetical protein